MSRQDVGALACQRLLPILRQPRAGLCCDFDGTLSPIVTDPTAALLHPLARDALVRLRHALTCVAVLSGRMVDDLRQRVGIDGLVYIGEHGAEWLIGDQRWVLPEAQTAAQAVATLAAEALYRFASLGVVVEAKRFSLSLHYRAAPDPSAIGPVLEDWARRRVAQSFPQLQVTVGRMLVELRPSLAISKGYAVRILVDRFTLQALVVAGDDRTDLDAMRALRALRDTGRIVGVAVGVTSAEAPPELPVLADVLLPDVDAVATCLAALADALAR